MSDADLLRREAEEPRGLDDFEPLVRHRGRVDGDLAAHAPVGMGRCLVGADRVQLLEGPVAEGAARGGNDELLYLGAAEALGELEESRVLGIDRQDSGLPLPRASLEEGPGHHDALLIREREIFAGSQRGQGGHEASRARGSVDDYVGLGRGDELLEPRSAPQVDAWNNLALCRLGRAARREIAERPA